MLKKKLGLFLGILSAIGLLTGCGAQFSPKTAAADTAEATTDAATPQVPFFTKGVYCNYRNGSEARDYFYIFYDEGAGYTEDGNMGIGVPFACEQKDNKVVFSFGGADEKSKQEFVVKSAKDGIITGEFDGDGIENIFELLSDADPDDFDGMAYIGIYGTSEEAAVYEDPNGWKVRYIASDFEVTTEGGVTTFVYTKESPGTNMITATYVVPENAETYINALAESWGSENVTVTKSIFPGTEDVDGYWAALPPSEDGSGLYETAIARDYMDGTLVFELTGHNSGNDEIDIPISDELAMIIDSIEFSDAQ